MSSNYNSTTVSPEYHPSNPEYFEFTILNRRYAVWRPTRNTWMVYAFRTGATVAWNDLDDMLDWIEQLSAHMHRNAAQRAFARSIRRQYITEESDYAAQFAAPTRVVTPAMRFAVAAIRAVAH